MQINQLNLYILLSNGNSISFLFIFCLFNVDAILEATECNGTRLGCFLSTNVQSLNLPFYSVIEWFLILSISSKFNIYESDTKDNLTLVDI